MLEITIQYKNRSISRIRPILTLESLIQKKYMEKQSELEQTPSRKNAWV